MAAVNKKNAARNFQNAFKNVGARPEGARTADDGVDPFSRRKTRPMNYWNTNKQRGATAGAGDSCHDSLSHTSRPRCVEHSGLTSQRVKEGLCLDYCISYLLVKCVPEIE